MAEFEGKNNKCRFCGKPKEAHIPEGYDEWEYEPCSEQQKHLEEERDREHIAWCSENNFCGMPWKYFNKKLSDAKFAANNDKEKANNEDTRKLLSLYCENIRDMYYEDMHIYIHGGSQEDRSIALSCIAHAAAKSCIKVDPPSNHSGAKAKYLDITYLHFENIVEAAYEYVRGTRKKFWDIEDDPNHDLTYVGDAIEPDVLLIDGFDVSLFHNRDNMVKNTISVILSTRSSKQRLTVISGKSEYTEAEASFQTTLSEFEEVQIMGSVKKPKKLAKKLVDITKSRSIDGRSRSKDEEV